MNLNTSRLSLSSYDYIIIVGTLIFSTLIGIYYGCFGTKQGTITQYLLGGKKMKIVPVAISVAISHISGTLLLGTVAEVHRYGASIWLMVISYIVMGLLAVFVYNPVFFKLEVTNIYEYLEKRFDRRTRTVAFVFYLLCEILLFPVLAYSPSLTFATASGIRSGSAAWPAFILCLICVFYTSIGGLKTVVWTDFLQFGIIVTSFVTIYVVGVNSSGGFFSIWKTALDGDRLQIFNFSVDITARDSFWAYSISVSLALTSLIVVHQTGAQKFLSLPTYRDSIWSVLYTVISMSLVHTFSVFIGLTVYAKYKDCDPLTSHRVSKHDQVFPYFVADIGADLPGVCGLFLAAVASAALSSMSSNMNALAGVIYKDVIYRCLKKKPSERKGSVILKMLVFVIGVLCSCLVFTIEQMGEIFSISALISGITQGPILGVFTLGILFPQANHKGAVCGLIGGCISVASIAIPTKYYQMRGLFKSVAKSLSTSCCDSLHQFVNTTNSVAANSTNTSLQAPFQPPAIFRISFYYYALIGAGMTVFFGLIISYLTKSDFSVDRNLLSPIVHPCLSRKRQDEGEVRYSMVERELEILD